MFKVHYIRKVLLCQLWRVALFVIILLLIYKSRQELYLQLMYSVIMIVYIEYVIIDNLIIDSIVLYMASMTVGISVKWWKLLFASLIGVVVAILFPIVPVVVGYVLRVVGIIAMCSVLTRHKLVWLVLLSVAYTFLLGGCIMALLSVLDVNYDVSSNNCVYYSNIPVSIYVLAVVLVAYLSLLVYRYILSWRRAASYIVKCMVIVGSSSYSVKGYYDSGNSLVSGGKLVCFVTGKLKKVVASEVSSNLLRGRRIVVNYDTVTGQSQSLACYGQVVVGGNSYSVLLAMQSTSSDSYDILLNNAMIGGSTE